MVVVNHEGRTAWAMPFVQNEKVSELVQRTKDRYEFSFVGGTWQVQETREQGRVLPPEEIVMDEREYYLTGWITTTGPRPLRR